MRVWNSGDHYWELWESASEDRYFPLCSGIVDFVDDGIVRLVGCTWRFLGEGLPFNARADAVLYALDHRPSDEQVPESSVRRSSPVAELRTESGCASSRS
jgi:hypothetical protein